MARSMTKTTPQTNETISSFVETENATIKSVQEITSPTKSEPKQFQPTDAIKCVSITAGELGMIGIKSNINYTWAGRGDDTDVEYQDLVAAIRSGKPHITKPYFIIQDKDFLEQFPQVETIYSSMYSYKDLKDVLNLDVANMKTVILNLPAGAKDAIKNIASTMISEGKLDSVQKIKILDEIFDTKFMLMTELYK